MRMPRFVSISLVCLFCFCACATTKSSEQNSSSIKHSSLTLCKSIDRQGNTGVPEFEAKIFSPYDRNVIAHMMFNDVRGICNIRWEWLKPNGDVYYDTNNVPVQVSEGKYVKRVTAWHPLTIRGDTAGTIPGQWRVRVYLNDELKGNETFTIEDHNLVAPPPPGQALKTKPNSWGVVIGIEDYKSLPPALYAKKDAQVMKEYFIKTFGVPEKNIIEFYNEDATKLNIEESVNTYLTANVEKNSTVFVYFSGHGMPDKNEKPTLIPYNANRQFMEGSLYSLEELYDKLNNPKIQRAFVFVDACFSGTNREGEQIVPDKRITRVKPTEATGPVVAFSAASGNQTSIPHDKAEHGLFTFYLLKAISGEADVDGNDIVSVEEAHNYVSNNVTRMSKRLTGEPQDPQVTPPSDQLKNVNLNYVAW